MDGHTRRERASLLSDESGVSEVVGFIFMFTMAFIVLSLTMTLVSDRVRQSTDSSKRSTFSEAGSKLASAIREAVTFADLHGDVRFGRTVSVPSSMAGTGYRITVTNQSLHVNASQSSDDLTLRFSGFDLDGEGIAFRRTVTSARSLEVTYRVCPDTAADGPCGRPIHQGEKSLFIDEIQP